MRLVPALLAAACFPAAASAQTPAATPLAAREGEAAMPGRWYVEGGDAAHNGSTANAPLLRRPRVAWRQIAGGTIVGEPLVWDAYVVLAIKVSEKRRGIEVRRLDDGGLVGQRVLDSTNEQCPTVWGSDVVWRAPDGLELARFGKGGVSLVARMPKAKIVGPPLRLGARVYATVDGTVTCMRAGDFRVVWRSENSGFVGPLAIGDQRVYAIATGSQALHVIGLDRRTGAVVETSRQYPLPKPVGDDARLQLAGNDLLVALGTGDYFGVARGQDVAFNGVQMQLPLSADGKVLPIALSLPHALDVHRHVGLFATPQGVQLGLFEPGAEQGVRLDGCDAHRELARVAPTLAPDVMYFGACAVGLDRRVLWRIARDGDKPLPRARAIPAGRTMLLAADKELVALREDAPADAVPAELQAAWLADVRNRLTKLVDDAVAAADFDLASDLLARCREVEVGEDWVTKREKDVAQKATGKQKPDAARAAAVRKDADAVGAKALDEVHRSLAGWSTRPPLQQRQALRYVLARDALHAAAQADVRALLPKGIAPPEPFLATDWLDFLDAAAITQVSFLEGAEDYANEKDIVVAQSKRELVEWRHRWRDDLRALQSPRLVLLSPITSPGSLAKALATGELVCDLLESMFAGMPRMRDDPRPMMACIYGDRAEYLAQSKKLGVQNIDWTAGYYSDSLPEHVAKSRLYVPADDAGFASVLPTFAHELTHQWLNDRCQAFVPDRDAVREGRAAFWIVEGFASLVEQFDFDLARRQFRLGVANLERADLVASATESQLLDWDGLVTTPRAMFTTMTLDRREVAVPSAVHLGESFRTRRVSLFYAQSAMLVRYLYEAEDGVHRKALLDYVAAYYTGKHAALDFAAAFGAPAHDFAPRVVAFAKALVQ